MFHSLFATPHSLPCFVSLSFAGLVVLARSLNPIPSRTRPLNSSAPMVLWLKPWESRSLPGLPRTKVIPLYVSRSNKTPSPSGGGVFCFGCVRPERLRSRSLPGLTKVIRLYVSQSNKTPSLQRMLCARGGGVFLCLTSRRAAG